MFDKNLKKSVKNLDKLNVRKSPIKRQERSDKKTDIKIPLLKGQRMLIRRLAKMNEMFPTNYCTHLVKKGLIRKIPFPIPQVPYPSSSPLTFHVRLEKQYLEILDQYCIEWDCSRREAAYRVLIGLINTEGEYFYERKY